MATGVPSKNHINGYAPVRLAYEGKQERSDILNGERSIFDEVHSCLSRKRLYFGDNLKCLRTLLSDSKVRGRVTLVYIDPPFATQGMFLSRKQCKAYEDTLSGAEYVEYLRERLILLRELLAEDGSLYLHLDEKMVFEMKLVMDDVFGASNYRNMIVRKKCNPKNYTRKTYGNIADFILFYSKTDKYVWNRPMQPLSKESAKEYHYIEQETGRRYMKVPIHAPGTRNGATGGHWKGMLPPPGKHWQYTPKTLDEMDERGEIFWSKNGNPRRKIYLDEHTGVGIQDIWLDFKDAHNQNIRITGYPTEKNPDLLRRIIAASSNPGDMILDCFAGSGTTLAIADEMQRNWIGMDNSPESLSTILGRFAQGLLPMGDYTQNEDAGTNKNAEQPTLFDTLEERSTPHTSESDCAHIPIVDFSIFIERGTQSDAHSLVTKWQERNEPRISKEAKPQDKVSEAPNFAKICYQLHSQDKKLAKIIDTVGPCALVRGHAGFDFLVDAIIGQQLSKNAADTIIKRFRGLFPDGRATPKKFLSLPQAKVLKTGMSGRKFEYITDLARRIEGKQLKISELDTKDDAAVRQILKEVKGIGDWTIDMYLLFGLARLDIFPVHDLALRKAISKVYGLTVDDRQAIEKITERWKPYRSVGSWYLYKYGNMKA